MLQKLRLWAREVLGTSGSELHSASPWLVSRCGEVTPRLPPDAIPVFPVCTKCPVGTCGQQVTPQPKSHAAWASAHLRTQTHTKDQWAGRDGPCLPQHPHHLLGWLARRALQQSAQIFFTLHPWLVFLATGTTGGVCMVTVSLWEGLRTQSSCCRIQGLPLQTWSSGSIN